MINLIPVTGIPEVRAGDDLAAMLMAALEAMNETLVDGDVLAVTQKVVSKAEGRVVALEGAGGREALVTAEAVEIVRRRGSLIVARTRHGFVCANAGVDLSNVEEGSAVLLPVDPDRSAHRLRLRLQRAAGARIGVVITDTFGRAWRRGQTDVAIGVSGIPAILDLRGTTDDAGRTLEVTEIAVADEVAAAAELAKGKARRVPAVVVRGLELPPGTGRAADLVRDPAEDLFL